MEEEEEEGEGVMPARVRRWVSGVGLIAGSEVISGGREERKASSSASARASRESCGGGSSGWEGVGDDDDDGSGEVDRGGRKVCSGCDSCRGGDGGRGGGSEGVEESPAEAERVLVSLVLVDGEDVHSQPMNVDRWTQVDRRQ